MWRVLETELRTLLTGHEGGNAGYSQGVSFELVAPALDPTSVGFITENQPTTRQTGFGEGVRPAKAGMFSGRQSHRGKSQKPCNLGRIRGGNEAGEADRQSHRRMASESPGRNASEPSGGLDKKIGPEVEPPPSGRRQHGATHADRCG